MPKVILRSLYPDRKMYFTARINVRDESDYNRITTSVNVTQNHNVYYGEVRPSDPCWRIRFDDNRSSYFIEWREENGKPKSEIDKQKKLAAEWLGRHDQVKTLFGEPNKNLRGEALYSLEWEGMKNTSIADENIKKFEVFEKLMGLSAEEKRDCAFFYGVNASVLKHSELLNRLGSFENGVLHSSKMRDGEKLSIRDHFLTMYGKETISDVKLITEKSLVYNFISKTEKGYWFNEEFIGITFENIYEYLNGNANVKNLLKREIGKKESPVEDDMVDEVKKNAAAPVEKDPKKDVEKAKAEREAAELQELRRKDIENDELYKLRNKAVELGIPYARVSGKDKLLVEIEKAEKKIKHGVSA